MTDEELERLQDGAAYVGETWRAIVDVAAELATVERGRTGLQSLILDGGLVHYRCAVNFLCGNYAGVWHPTDLKPPDFLGCPWVIADEQYDRHLRGRLRIVNIALAHLSWRRRDEFVAWPFGLLAHEADHALRLFLADVPTDAPWRRHLDFAGKVARDRLPPRQKWSSSTVELAPPRRA
jgi:hypothetical protein